MFHKIVRSLALALACALVLILPAAAGGWAVITLDALPGPATPGQPVQIGFMVRQHGHTPMSGLEPTVTARPAGGGEALTVQAQPGDRPGHYTAELNFPQAGTWNWRIQAFSMDQPMPPIEVSAALPPAAGAPGAGAPISPLPAPVSRLPLLVGGLGLAGAAASLAVFRRGRPRWAPALLAVSGFLVLAALVSAAPLAATLAAPQPVESEAKVSEALGAQLFLAKGCVTCHENRAVPVAADTFRTFAGPDLTQFSSDPDRLRTRLKDPAAIQADTQMPNLELKKEEIEALVAFLNEGD